jgi:CheY-like chemotaxis protein
MQLPGNVIGPFRILSEIASGAMGTVYLASVERRSGDLRPRDCVALKLIHPHLVSSPDSLARFLLEAEAGRRVVHPNVVRTLDAGTVHQDGRPTPYLAMEMVEGTSLQELRREIPRFPEDLCRQVGRDIARGLAAIHAAGIVHRDLKPENVLCSARHEIKIADFGVARVCDDAARLSRTGDFLGSLLYASPEQFSRSRVDLDGRSDLYSLGWLLYVLAAGSHPLEDHLTAVTVIEAQLRDAPPDLLARNPGLSPFFAALVAALLEKDRSRRLPSAQAVAETLTLGEESPWWKSRSRAAVAVAPRPRPAPAPSPTATPFLDRTRETDVLRARWLLAAEGQGGAVLVEGPPGIGKTRLVQEFAARAAREGAVPNFLAGCWGPGGPGATDAFRQALRGYLVPTCDGGRRADAEPSAEDLLRGLRAAAAGRPALVLLEELDRAPEEGLRLFEVLSRALAADRVLLVGTAGPGLPEGWAERMESDADLARLRPGPLSREELRDLVAERLGNAPSEGLTEALLARSGGNPLAAGEMLEELVASGAVTAGSAGGEVDAAAAVGRLPAGLEGIYEARIARLADADREVLELAACAGKTFSPVALASALGLSPIPVLRRLVRMEQEHRIVRCLPDGYAFRHSLVQRVVARRLPPPLIREYRAALARAEEGLRSALGSAPTVPGGPAIIEVDLTSLPEGCATVLIADDEPRIRELLCKHVAALGYRPVAAANGLDALARMRSGRVDVALLDLEMPGMGGLDVMRRARTDPALRSIPVVFVTGVADPEVAASCILEGADDFVVKPFNAPILHARIRACVERHRLAAQERGARRRAEEALCELERALEGIARGAPAGREEAGRIHAVVAGLRAEAADVSPASSRA